jgi:hypothetical protein
VLRVHLLNGFEVHRNTPFDVRIGDNELEKENKNKPTQNQKEKRQQ